MDWHREVKKHQRMTMAVENMAHDNMSVSKCKKESPLMMRCRSRKEEAAFGEISSTPPEVAFSNKDEHRNEEQFG